jgi:hypothetical protein
MNRAESTPAATGQVKNSKPRLPEDLPSSLSSKVRPGHLCRKAIVYIRQSTAQQILNNRESTARQYALDRRAVQLGWTPESVVIVDEDQARSGKRPRGDPASRIC